MGAIAEARDLRQRAQAAGDCGMVRAMDAELENLGANAAEPAPTQTATPAPLTTAVPPKPGPRPRPNGQRGRRK
jgi:hypothetical protein